MRILYGIVGEGMGHATRSLVVLEHLLSRGHQVRVVVSGRAHRFLFDRLKERQRVTLDEIHGLELRYFGNRLGRTESLFANLRRAPAGIAKNVAVYRKVAEDGFRPEVVISDFESWAAFYALNHFLPVISIDNMQIINRCKHPKRILHKRKVEFEMTRTAVKIKLPGAYHYLITSFFFPKVRKKRTTLLPPILRPAILNAKREPGKHVLVYQTASGNEDLIATLKTLPHRFRLYGMGREGREANVTLCPFSETAFVDDLRTARALISGGGFSLMSEAVSLHVPMLSVPVENQFEQELNARYLAELGYGSWAHELERPVIESFLSQSDVMSENLLGYEPNDNGMLYQCVDELLERCAAGERRPERLSTEAMGSA